MGSFASTLEWKENVSSEMRPPKGEEPGVPFPEGFPEHSHITCRLEAGLPEPGVWRLTTAGLTK